MSTALTISEVNCHHGKPCALKTGTRPGSNYGKSFYICSKKDKRCSFTREVNIPHAVCPVHDAMVAVRYLKVKDGKKMMAFNCASNKDSFCAVQSIEDEKENIPADAIHVKGSQKSLSLVRDKKTVAVSSREEQEKEEEEQEEKEKEEEEEEKEEDEEEEEEKEEEEEEEMEEKEEEEEMEEKEEEEQEKEEQGEEEEQESDEEEDECDEDESQDDDEDDNGVKEEEVIEEVIEEELGEEVNKAEEGEEEDDDGTESEGRICETGESTVVATAEIEAKLNDCHIVEDSCVQETSTDERVGESFNDGNDRGGEVSEVVPGGVVLDATNLGGLARQKKSASNRTPREEESGEEEEGTEPSDDGTEPSDDGTSNGGLDQEGYSAEGDVEDDRGNSRNTTTDDTAYITANDITHLPVGQSQPVFRRVIYDSDEAEDEDEDEGEDEDKARSDQRRKQVVKTPGALGAQSRKRSSDKKIAKGADRDLSEDSPIVVASRGARRAIISSDEDEQPVVKPSKGLQKTGGEVKEEVEGPSNTPLAVNKPGVSTTAALNVGVAGRPPPSQLSHTPQRAAGDVPTHPPLMTNPPPHVPSPAFTQYRVPPSKVGGVSPPSGASGKKHIHSHHNESSQKPKPPLQEGAVEGTTGPKKTSPVLFQPDNQVVSKPKPKSPQDGHGKARGESDSKKTSPVPFQPDVTGSVPFQPDNVAGPPPLKVTPPQSSSGTKLDAKPAVPKVSPESGGATVKKVSPPGAVQPSGAQKTHGLLVAHTADKPQGFIAAGPSTARVPTTIGPGTTPGIGPGTTRVPTTIGPGTTRGPTTIGPGTTHGPTTIGPGTTPGIGPGTARVPTNIGPAASHDPTTASAKGQSLASGSVPSGAGVGEEGEEEGEEDDFSKEPEFKVGHQYRKLLQQYQQLEHMIRTLSDKLPDKGAQLHKQKAMVMERMTKMKRSVPRSYEEAAKILASITTTTTTTGSKAPGAQMHVQSNAMAKMLTSGAVEHLHQSLASCPTEDCFADDPPGLRVNLMPHQKRALAWLEWRETQTPSGGILADDMGLGKTLSLLALVVKQKQSGKDKPGPSEGQLIRSSATLVVAPASLMGQWKDEASTRVDPGLLNICVYHGPKRTEDPRCLARYDLVVTTYTIVRGEGPTGEEEVCKKKLNALFGVHWKRIILDEAHVIKNPKAATSVGICNLKGDHRWGLTGTPIQNELKDFYSLIRFIGLAPFDDYRVWKDTVEKRGAVGMQRLNTVVSSLVLRRTKLEVESLKLPQRVVEYHQLSFSPEEQVIYDVLFAAARRVFCNYLQQQGEHFQPVENQESAALQALSKMDELVRKAVFSMLLPFQAQIAASKSRSVLTLLLRLRQCCGHLSLLVSAIKRGEAEEDLDLDLQMGALTLDGNDSESQQPVKPPDTELFSADRTSTKLLAVMSQLERIREQDVPGQPPCKSVIVSQWVSMLDIFEAHLKKRGFTTIRIDGTVPPQKRLECVKTFNNPGRNPSVMLLSLQAGGVGLNLVGGNHVFIVDMHWNPALEEQAADRCHRMGQKRDVYIHRFVCQRTVEDQIVRLQEKKLKLSNDVLSGGSRKAANNKLSLSDLKYLFDMK